MQHMTILYPISKPELIQLKYFFPFCLSQKVCLEGAERKALCREKQREKLCTDLKLINILSQPGTNRVCLAPDGHACASQRWNRRQKSIRFS